MVITAALAKGSKAVSGMGKASWGWVKSPDYGDSMSPPASATIAAH